MSNLDRRIGRLEERLMPENEPRVIVRTNIRIGIESPYHLEIAPGHFAYVVRGAPFTPEEIAELKAEHSRDRQMRTSSQKPMKKQFPNREVSQT